MVGFKGKKRSWEQRRCMGRVSNTPHLVPAFSQFLRFYVFTFYYRRTVVPYRVRICPIHQSNATMSSINNKYRSFFIQYGAFFSGEPGCEHEYRLIPEKEA